MNYAKLSWLQLGVLYASDDVEIYTAVCCEVMRRVVNKYEPQDRDYAGGATAIRIYTDRNGILEMLADRASGGDVILKEKWLNEMKEDGVYVESCEGNFQKSSDEFFHMASKR